MIELNLSHSLPSASWTSVSREKEEEEGHSPTVHLLVPATDRGPRDVDEPLQERLGAVRRRATRIIIRVRMCIGVQLRGRMYKPAHAYVY